jgi:nucleotide-binding universal stress UspA family protein
MNRWQLRHILCPIDLSPMSMNALRWANSMARARAAELRVFHVVAATGTTTPERLGFLERDHHMVKLREALATVDSTNDRTGAAVRLGDPGAQILQFARSLPADLIVMGAAGAERPERPMGSMTATVVARCQCPVLIVPAARKINPGTPGLFKRIVCAVDLAPASVSVIRQAVSLARETGALVTCACIMMDPEPSSSEIHDRLLMAIPPEARGWCDIEVVNPLR